MAKSSMVPVPKASSATNTSEDPVPVRRQQTVDEVRVLAYRFPRKYSPMQLLVLAKKLDATDAR